jgi:hypothetical protein
VGRRELGVGLVCGALVGLYLGWGFGPNRPWEPSFTAAARASPRGACPEVPEAPRDAASVIEAQDRQIRALSDLAFGRPLVWPDPELPARVEQALEEAVATCAPGVTLVETDCSEPPCLAAFDLDAETTVSEQCPDVPRSGWKSARIPCPDGPHWLHVVEVGSPHREANEVEDLDFGENLFDRVQDRSRDLFRAFTCP